MKYFRNVYILLFILIALSLIVFFYTSENTVKINKNCPIGEVESRKIMGTQKNYGDTILNFRNA